MVDAPTIALTVTRVVVLFLALGVTRASYRAYKRTGEPFLRTATIGFATISVGILLEGALFNLSSLDLTMVHIVESVTVGLGLFALYYSLRQ